MAKTETVYRHLPFDVRVEQALLGYCLIDNLAIEKAAETLAIEDFYDPLHERLFEAMLELTREFSVRVTPLVLHAAMKADPGMMQVGGLAYLTGMAEAAPAGPPVREYARIIADLRVRREFIHAGEDFVNEAYAQPLELPTAKVMARAEAAMQRIHIQHAKILNSNRPRPAGEFAERSIKAIEDRMTTGGHGLISSGFERVDGFIGGYGPGDLVIVCGRPGMGKSALMCASALSAATEGRPVQAFSLEMLGTQWTDRNICDLDFDRRQMGMEKPLYYENFRRARLTPREFERMVLMQQELSAMLHYEVCDEPTLTVEEICAKARAFRSIHQGRGMGLIVVDYLQKVRESDLGRGTSRERHVSHIASSLKNLAKELGWPVMAGSQTNRQSEERQEKDRKPRLSDLRESGQIEAEADIVIGPYRKAYYIGKERPEGGENDPEYMAWVMQYRQWKNRMDLCGLKFRHGSEFEVDIWCDMGASALRDNETTAVTQAQADLKLGL
jgi:replicative DNA helicase